MRCDAGELTKPAGLLDAAAVATARHMKGNQTNAVPECPPSEGKDQSKNIRGGINASEPGRDISVAQR